jgi:hypothetical protein
MNTLKIDPEFKKLIPQLSEDERTRLTENLIDDGCRDPLVVWNGVLLDGHNRFAICTENDIAYETTPAPPYVRTRDDALDWIDKNQIGRRNLSRDDFKIVLGRIYNRSKNRQGGDRKSKCQNDTLIDTAAELAKEHNVSPATVKRAGKLAEAVEKVEAEEPDVAAEGREAVVTKAKAEVKKSAAPGRPKQDFDYRPSNGMMYAATAISELSKIQRNDTQRTEAFEKVFAWMESRMKSRRRAEGMTE